MTSDALNTSRCVCGYEYRKMPGPRISIRPSRDGLNLPNGTDYTIRHNGRIVAEGWTAGGTGQALRDATVRCEEYERSGSWVSEAAETAGAA